MGNKIIVLCPHCNEEIKDNDERIVCESCGMTYHKLCWDLHNGCATFACSANRVIEDPVIEDSSLICKNCGAVIEPGNKFCMKCGTAVVQEEETTAASDDFDNFYDEFLSDDAEIEGLEVPTSVYVCSSCGTEYEPGMKFCMKCGSKIPELKEEEQQNNVYVCGSCGTEYEPGMKFCMKCGSKLPEIKEEESVPLCSNCGAEYEPGMKFCMKCGNKLPQEAPAEEPAEPAHICSNCGTEYEPGMKFCMKCGKRI